MNIFISGGCKNGKSYYAQKLAKSQEKEEGGLYYIATMIPSDAEDYERIVRHQSERAGWGFETIECKKSINDELSKIDGSFLIDSITALLSNEMFDNDGNFDKDASERVAKDLSLFLDNHKDVVLVSDYIYSDAIKYEKLTEEYIKGLAHVDRILAKKCELVMEVSYGNVRVAKGEELL